MGIVRAELVDLEQCADILFRSDLGHNYYPNIELLQREVELGIKAEEVYVAKNCGVSR